MIDFSVEKQRIPVDRTAIQGRGVLFAGRFICYANRIGPMAHPLSNTIPTPCQS
jgi:hypothetical protein